MLAACHEDEDDDTFMSAFFVLFLKSLGGGFFPLFLIKLRIFKNLSLILSYNHDEEK